MCDDSVISTATLGPSVAQSVASRRPGANLVLCTRARDRRTPPLSRMAVRVVGQLRATLR